MVFDIMLLEVEEKIYKFSPAKNNKKSSKDDRHGGAIATYNKIFKYHSTELMK